MVKSANSPKKPKSQPLTFNSHQDALNYVSQLAEHGRGWNSRNSLSIADRYENGNLYVALQLRSVASGANYNFVFRAIVDGESWSKIPPSGESANAGMQNGFVFIGITQMVQIPQKIVPSFVWIACDHYVKDLWGDILGSSILATLNLGGSQPEREMGIPSLVGGSGNSGGIPSLVERSAKIYDNIESTPSKQIWDSLNTSNFMIILSGLRVEFGNDLEWRLITEDQNFPFKLIKASLRVSEGIF